VDLELIDARPVGKCVGLRNSKRSPFPAPYGELNGALGWLPEDVPLIQAWNRGEQVTGRVKSRSYLTTPQLARSVGVGEDRLQKWVQRYQVGRGRFPAPAVILVWPKKAPMSGWDPEQLSTIRPWVAARTRDDDLDRTAALPDDDLVRLRDEGMPWRRLAARGGVTPKTVRRRYDKLTGQE
jgi:hypothetical protein